MGVDGGAEIREVGRKGMSDENGILSDEIGPAESSEGGIDMTAWTGRHREKIKTG